MSWSGAAAATLAVVVGVGLSVLGRRDAATGRVPVAPARQLSGLALIGLLVVGVAAGRWEALIQAGVGAVLVTGLQALPYVLQRDREWIGRADVRLGLPFGWTLGWFGIGFTVIGFLAALVAGLAVSAVTGRRRIPFVPFLAVGYWLALAWAAVVAGR